MMISTAGPQGPFTDTFDRADSSTTPNPASDGHTWTAWVGPWGIASNTLRSVGTSAAVAPFTTHSNGPGSFRAAGAFLGADLGSNTVTVIATLINGNGAAFFELFPAFDVNTGTAYLVDIKGTTLTVQKCTGWTTTVNMTGGATFSLSGWNGAGGVLGSGKMRVKVVTDGAGGLKVYQDIGAGFVQKASVTDPGTTLTGTGLLLSCTSSTTDANWDDYSATSP